MHDDVTCPEGIMGVVIRLKSKMAASSASSGENSRMMDSFDLSESENKSPECYTTAQPHQNTCQHNFHLNFPLRGNTQPYSIHLCLKLPQCMFVHQKNIVAGER